MTDSLVRVADSDWTVNSFDVATQKYWPSSPNITGAIVRVFVFSPDAVSGRGPFSLNHSMSGSGKPVALQVNDTSTVPLLTLLLLGLSVIIGLINTEVLYEPEPAELVTVHVYVPPFSAVTCINVSVLEVSLTRSPPLKLHRKVFPEPPKVTHVSKTVSASLNVAS